MSQPVVIARIVGGGGLELFIEYPEGTTPAPVMISEAHKDDFLMELLGQSPIPGCLRLPAIYLGPIEGE